MAAVLGLSAQYHDAAAALVVDGRIVAAMQEERFTRKKNDATLPIRAARACLSFAKMVPGDLDEIVFYESPFSKLERVMVSLLHTWPRSFRQFPRALGAQLGGKIWVLDSISEQLDVPRERITTREHHHSHAASAFFTSPFANAAVLTVDGVGESISTAIWKGEGRSLSLLASIEFPHSLGLLYAALTAYLGFEVNEGEYKVMGLAAFGKPRLREQFGKLISVYDDGSFTLGLPYFGFLTDTELGFGPKMEELLGPRRAPGRAWDFDGRSEDRKYADIAATLQAVTEEALLAMAKRAQKETGAEHLCLAGGVALNAVANARILRESGFARVFVHPAAGDAGGALGAAILGSIDRGDPRPEALASSALGLPIDNDRARELAKALGVTFRSVDDPATTIAEHIADEQVIAVARGRFEWGPRALGQRSILASPRHVEMRERLNRVVKRREPFRPFAPAALEDAALAMFDDSQNDMTPFMTTVCNVKQDHRADLAAVTHTDGTARLQTVSATSSPELHEILQALERTTGDAVVLNTSLNGRGEPIVASAADALSFFVSHPIDAMMVGDILLEKERR